ncbi:MAG: hypothetical protein QM778_14785 [Myxococcales bacterium]
MHEVTLQRVEPHEASILSNLLELYCHDMSAYFPVTLGSDGRFGYSLERYFTEPQRFPYFILVERKLAGFALATRGSPASADPEHLDVAEFFVLRSLRGRNVGERAAGLLWDQLPGRWLVRVACVNRPALAFWPRAIERYTGRPATSRKFTQNQIERDVFEFDSVIRG